MLQIATEMKRRPEVVSLGDNADLFLGLYIPQDDPLLSFRQQLLPLGVEPDVSHRPFAVVARAIQVFRRYNPRVRFLLLRLRLRGKNLRSECEMFPKRKHLPWLVLLASPTVGVAAGATIVGQHHVSPRHRRGYVRNCHIGEIVRASTHGKIVGTAEITFR